MLSVLAVIGLVLTWRRRRPGGWPCCGLAGAALALGPTLQIGAQTYIPLADRWHGVTVSLLLPYTWLVRVPGLSALREADRLALVGLLGAAILAGTAVQWLTQHAWPVISAAVVVVVVAGAAPGGGLVGYRAQTMRATMPSVDAAIAADPSHSIVVDVPFGLRGGVGVTGFKMPPESLVLATATATRGPCPTPRGCRSRPGRDPRNPFYRCLYGAQNGQRNVPRRRCPRAGQPAARRRKIGWVIVWHSRTRAARPPVIEYLTGTGFHIDYRVTTPQAGITVWHRK